ncbi:MAG: TonB-dependent receptor [Sphingomonadales bacterium]|nr:TonB-dependent receptor [Sphingomonadales bacterium]NCQ20540.1 TonB-dependent receptor [Sphingomonadales bacterium]NCT03148.1 TonB-dependent receptor [Sphingomonadales bacterium]
MNLSPLSRAGLRAGTCALALVLALPLSAEAGATAQPQPDPAAAPEQEEPDSASDTGDTGNEIVVRSGRLRGQLFVDQAPLLELDETAIAAEGVTSITDLIAQISARTGSARGRGGGGQPVILVNGIRIGSFREFANYPPEALARVEVFPEEVAQRFGFPPDRRVINLILKDNYSNRQIDLEFEAPSRGGYVSTEQQLGILKIADGGRINANIEVQDTSILTEDERNIRQTEGSVSLVPGDPDPAQFRSLLADTFGLEANLSWAKAIIDSGTSLSANLNYDRSESRSLDGLNSIVLSAVEAGPGTFRTFGGDTPLARRSSTDTVSTAGSVTKRVNAFRLTSTFDGSFAESETEIDRRLTPDQLEVFENAALAGALAVDGPLPGDTANGFDVARSRSITGSSLTTLEGPVGSLPAGEVLATFDVGLNWQRIESADTRSSTDVALTRRQLSTGANLVVPLTSTREEFADALGTFTLNLQAGIEDLSDFGVLGDWNAGITWQPFDGLDLSATYILREVAPGLTTLGNPQITNFNVPVFDFVRGETVLADVRTGGNPDLPAETQRDWKFSANWELPFWENSRFGVDYIRNRSDNVVSGFPQITSDIEAAFPGRVTRDADGRLIAIDRRQVSFAETRADRIQFTFSTNGSIGAPAEGEGGGRGRRFGGGAPAATPPAAPEPAPPTTGPTTGAAPAAQAAQGGRPAGGMGFGAGSAATPEQREQFMAFRTRLCADDGQVFLEKLVAAIDSGADVSAEFPGIDPARLAPMLARLRGADGAIDPARLAQFRTRICAIDPATMAAAGGGSGTAATLPPPFAAFRERACGPDGVAVLAGLVAKIDRGEDVSAELPGMDPAFIKMALDRSRLPDGTIPPEALAQFQQRFCAATPAAGGAGGPPAAGGGAPAGGPAFNPLAQRSFPGWRYFFNLTHTIELANQILIAPGLAPLDQLDGQATGAFGQPRHSSRLEAGLFGKGVGFRLSGIYTGETRLDGAVGSSDLFFDDIATFNLRIFANMGEVTGKNEGVLKDFRVSLVADNLFDAQRSVQDSAGETPVNYQPFVIDPLGLYLGIDLRKLF